MQIKRKIFIEAAKQIIIKANINFALGFKRLFAPNIVF